MASDPYALFRRNSRYAGCRRVVRDKNKKAFPAVAHTSPQTSQTHSQKIHANPVTHGFAKTKEGFANAVSKPDAEKEIEAQEAESITNARAGGNSITNSGRNSTSFTIAVSFSGEKSRAQRHAFA